MAEVVVFNKNAIIPVRHIVSTNEPYNEDAFKAWYYDNYHELEGDSFAYCATRQERDKLIESLNRKQYARKVVPFDAFASQCPYFDSESEVNNGYGCNHEKQTEKQHGKGCCYCFSCPLGVSADEESLNEKDIDWSEVDVEDIGEDDYIIVPIEQED